MPDESPAEYLAYLRGLIRDQGKFIESLTMAYDNRPSKHMAEGIIHAQLTLEQINNTYELAKKGMYE